MNILILGDGLLGSELVKQTGWTYISRKKSERFNFTTPSTYEAWFKYPFDTIINCIACTDTYSTKRKEHWAINYKAVSDLVDLCNQYNKKLVHISTDYLYTFSKDNATENDVPVHCRNWYGYTKLLADGYVQLKADNFLLIRSTHKAEPFTFDTAWTTQTGNFDYVSVIADLIIKLITKDSHGIYNVGTEVKTMYDLAKRTAKNVKPTSTKLDESTPSNLIMDIKKMNKALS